MSRRCSSSDFTAPGEMESASMSQGRPIIAGFCPLLQVSARPPGNIRECCRQFLLSGIKSALFQRESYALDREQIGADPVVDGVRLRKTYHYLKAALDSILQRLIACH